MARGMHSRDWVNVDAGYECGGVFSAWLVHEEPCTEHYGHFGIIENQYCCGKYFVIWRPNRNHTNHWDIKVMVDPSATDNLYTRNIMSFDGLDEAIRSIPYWNQNFTPPRRTRSRTRDAQKSKVYRWEWRMAGVLGLKEYGPEIRLFGKMVKTPENSLIYKRSNEYLKNMLDQICKELGEDPVELKFRKGGRHSFGGDGIRLLPCHKNQLILMHELAHVLHRRWGNEDHDGVKHQAHGKEFVGFYMYLLIRFCGVTRDEITQHADMDGIKWKLPAQFNDWFCEEAA